VFWYLKFKLRWDFRNWGIKEEKQSRAGIWQVVEVTKGGSEWA
jgi:hypothetical protein